MDRPAATSRTTTGGGVADPGPVDPDPAVVGAAEAGVTRVLGTTLALPADATFVADGTSVRLDALDTGMVWTLVLGHVGTVEHALLTGYDGPAQVTGALFGTTLQLHDWVHGRLGTTALEVEGDPTVVDRLRRLLDAATPLSTQ